MLEEYPDGVKMKTINVGKEVNFNIIVQTLKKERCGKNSKKLGLQVFEDN